MNNLLELKNINKNYYTLDGEIPAIKDISLNINKNEIISLVGPSGCGKSTLLSLISDIDKDYKGTINKPSNLIYSYMLQSDALLPFLTIYDNALLNLKINKKLNNNNTKYVDYLFNLYNLNDFKNKYPNSLSGGMKQRVALIRTLSIKPDILLLDEPFSALDYSSRLLISDDVYKIIKKEKKSAILVTHNIEEAITFSDKVIVLSNRPMTIKDIIDINIDNKESVYERRKDKLFNYYFDLIWKELDIHE